MAVNILKRQRFPLAVWGVTVAPNPQGKRTHYASSVRLANIHFKNIFNDDIDFSYFHHWVKIDDWSPNRKHDIDWYRTRLQKNAADLRDRGDCEFRVIWMNRIPIVKYIFDLKENNKNQLRY